MFLQFFEKKAFEMIKNILKFDEVIYILIFKFIRWC